MLYLVRQLQRGELRTQPLSQNKGLKLHIGDLRVGLFQTEHFVEDCSPRVTISLEIVCRPHALVNLRSHVSLGTRLTHLEGLVLVKTIPFWEFTAKSKVKQLHRIVSLETDILGLQVSENYPPFVQVF